MDYGCPSKAKRTKPCRRDKNYSTPLCSTMRLKRWLRFHAIWCRMNSTSSLKSSSLSMTSTTHYKAHPKNFPQSTWCLAFRPTCSLSWASSRRNTSVTGWTTILNKSNNAYPICPTGSQVPVHLSRTLEEVQNHQTVIDHPHPSAIHQG